MAALLLVFSPLASLDCFAHNVTVALCTCQSWRTLCLAINASLVLANNSGATRGGGTTTLTTYIDAFTLRPIPVNDPDTSNCRLLSGAAGIPEFRWIRFRCYWHDDDIGATLQPYYDNDLLQPSDTSVLVILFSALVSFVGLVLLGVVGICTLAQPSSLN
jgi:hypothetical protein